MKSVKSERIHAWGLFSWRDEDGNVVSHAHNMNERMNSGEHHSSLFLLFLDVRKEYKFDMSIFLPPVLFLPFARIFLAIRGQPWPAT